MNALCRHPAALNLSDAFCGGTGQLARLEMGLSKGAVVLFQGDSITDAGRSRDDFASAYTHHPVLLLLPVVVAPAAAAAPWA